MLANQTSRVASDVVHGRAVTMLGAIDNRAK
jgi:hypothetical protein